jgi:hypothetical protein
MTTVATSTMAPHTVVPSGTTNNGNTKNSSNTSRGTGVNPEEEAVSVGVSSGVVLLNMVSGLGGGATCRNGPSRALGLVGVARQCAGGSSSSGCAGGGRGIVVSLQEPFPLEVVGSGSAGIVVVNSGVFLGWIVLNWGHVGLLVAVRGSPIGHAMAAIRFPSTVVLCFTNHCIAQMDIGATVNNLHCCPA